MIMKLRITAGLVAYETTKQRVINLDNYHIKKEWKNMSESEKKEWLNENILDNWDVNASWETAEITEEV
jgi:hypothetical protein